jgi:hypothetical protein
MEPHVGQANFREPFPDLTNGASDFGQSNSVPKQLRDLTSTRQIAEAETATLLIQQTELGEFVYLVARQLAQGGKLVSRPSSPTMSNFVCLVTVWLGVPPR